MKYLFTFLFVFIFSIEIFAEFTVNHKCISIQTKILNLNFKEAKQDILLQKKEEPNNMYLVYLENFEEFAKLMISRKETDFYSFKENCTNRIIQIESGAKNSPYYLYTLSYMRLQLGAARFLFNEQIRSSYDILKAHSLIEENHKLFPHFKQNNKIRGIFHLVFGAIPNEYKWLTDMLGFTGDINTGMQLIDNLEKTTDLNEAEKIETIGIKTFALLFFKNDNQQAYNYIKKIAELEPEITSLALCRIILGTITGNVNDIFWLFEKEEIKKLKTELYFIYYLQAEAKMYRLENNADTYYLIKKKKYKGIHYIKATYWHLAWYYFLNDNKEKYQKYAELAATEGTAYISADKQAMRESTNTNEMNKTLIQARLLFDGGNYLRAKTLLLNNSEPEKYTTIHQRLEYFYRLARVYHSLNQYDEAISYYSIVIENGKNTTSYFAPYSALQIALIHEKKGEKTKAKEFFNLCISINNGEYKNGIEQKAKAGLYRVKS